MKTSLIVMGVVIASQIAGADGRKITFFHTSPMTNEIQIDQYESFKVVSAFSANPNFSAQTFFEKNGSRVYLSMSQPGPNIELTGPATVTLRTVSNGPTDYTGAVWLTLEIQPQTYDVNKSITLAPGSGAAITLESSTNLVNWSSATNGTYTNVLPPALFFRIKAERLP